MVSSEVLWSEYILVTLFNTYIIVNCCIETFRAFVTTHIGGAYFYIHEHYCLHALAWDSPASWVLAGLGIDFCFYWVHRAGHGQLCYIDLY